MQDPKRLIAMRKRWRLAAQKAAGGEVAVAADDLLALLDELGRATQSADRLRRQNRRLRLRCRKLGVELEGDGQE